jgi:hypothetical protein
VRSTATGVTDGNTARAAYGGRPAPWPGLTKFTVLGVNRSVPRRRSSGIVIHADRTGADDQDGQSPNSLCGQIRHAHCRTIQGETMIVSVHRDTGPHTHRRIRTCHHFPPCPVATAPDRHAARTVATHPEQGWGLLCNGVVLFDDSGELLPDGCTVTHISSAIPGVHAEGCGQHRTRRTQRDAAA